MLGEICSNTTSNRTKLVVYADNLSAPGRYSESNVWWNNLMKYGYPNSATMHNHPNHG